MQDTSKSNYSIVSQEIEIIENTIKELKEQLNKMRNELLEMKQYLQK